MHNNYIVDNISKNLIKQRKKRGFSQENIADELGVSQSTYSKIEKNASNVTISRLIRLAEFLKVELITLLEIGDKEKHSLKDIEISNETVKYMFTEVKNVYEKLLSAKDNHIIDLKNMIEKVGFR